jgi:ATP-dependent Clp protease ATP-binding subunit ClpA
MRAIVALREELKGLEASHVATALADGRSWSQIAEALGVSKQAAHRRHAGRVREAPPPPRPAPQRRLLVTGQARRVVDRARAEAETAGSEEVAPEHLLVGLLGDDHGTAVRALQSAGLELDAARAALPRGAGNRPLGRIPVSRTTRATLEDSLREAVRLGDSHLGVEHLLLALLRDPNGPASRLIARLGVEPEQVTRRVHELVGSG